MPGIITGTSGARQLVEVIRFITKLLELTFQTRSMCRNSGVLRTFLFGQKHAASKAPSTRIRIFLNPQLFFPDSKISPSTRMRWYPDSL